MPDPLHGIRILDLTNVLAGPFCCHQLAHMGAEVIKVEVPGSGDLARQLGADPDLNEKLMGVSFLAQNTGKQSITIDLKSSAGKEIFRKLVATADVLVENFRPGVMARLDLDYETLRRINPELVYCAISGFGQNGPLHEQPAYDQIIQGMSGVMSITGDDESAPCRVGYPVADTIGGLTGAFAISAALAKPKPGRGVMIDVSMLESVLATMGWVVSNFLVTGRKPQPLGNDNFTASPSGAFRTGEGLINIAANRQGQFEALCDVVEAPELKLDARFAARQGRLDNRKALQAALEERLANSSAAEWEERLNRAGVPAGRILSVPEVLSHPQIEGRDLLGSFTNVSGVDRPVRFARTGMRLDGKRPKTATPPPALGQHTENILQSLGYSRDEIIALQQAGVI
ncbi:MAG: CoA transferase [Acidiferrobacterales bacterium]|nr:CoA transferase [Acidiferrobacterales bacterium]